MPSENIRVADVDIAVKCVMPLGLHRVFPESQGDPVAQLQVDIGYSLGKPVLPTYSQKHMKIFVGENDGDGPSILPLVRHSGYLAGGISEHFRFVHAAGLQVDGKGVMLIGNSGNGKSTLARMLSGDLLDDDMLMASPYEMRRISNYGCKTNPDGVRIDLLLDDFRRSPIDYVFVLNNSQDPDHIVKISPANVPAEVTFDDRMHDALLPAYRTRMPVLFEAPVYEIGTKREPEETRKLVQQLISPPV